MEGMSYEYPCGARSAVEEHIIEDGLANVSIEGGERILDAISSSSVQRKKIWPTHIKYQNVRPRVNGATNINTLFLTARK
jgi:hypothetical protein